jgi:GTPase
MSDDVIIDMPAVRKVGTSSRVPESDAGYKEYKRSLIGLSTKSIQQKTEQMSFRLNEGMGETIYYLGVDDDGFFYGLSMNEIHMSIKVIKEMCKSLSANIMTIEICQFSVDGETISIDSSGSKSERRRSYEDMKTKKGIIETDGIETDVYVPHNFIAEVYIRKHEEYSYVSVSIATCGSVDSGKSSLIGRLISEQYDDGDGFARQFVLQMKHERDQRRNGIGRGQTSCISHQLLGFDTEGNSVNEFLHKTIATFTPDRSSWKSIIPLSSRTIHFLDLAGHVQYLKTTISGLTRFKPDYIMLAIDANKGIWPMTKEHLIWIFALRKPFFIIITKCDTVTEETHTKLMCTIEKFFRGPGIRKSLIHVIDRDGIFMSREAITQRQLIPVFSVSNLEPTSNPSKYEEMYDNGINLLKQFLNYIPVLTRVHPSETLKGTPVLCRVLERFDVAGVGIVLNARLESGCINVRDSLFLGPYTDGSYQEIVVKSIERNCIPTNQAIAESKICMSFRKFKRDIPNGKNIKRSGLIISTSPRDAVYTFIGEVKFIHTKTVYRQMSRTLTVRVGRQFMMNIGTVRQVVRIIGIKEINRKNVENTTIIGLPIGSIGKILFEFVCQPAYIEVNTPLEIDENSFKASGRVVEIAHG